ncbi:MAG: hypothetical protein GC168_16810 [Candidatus Hydrogenedens sp.]|nr:hypothetical protein [Candidatus Hydrogenedens sp.]
MTDDGYIDYFATLGLDASANPGEVKNHYRKRMKALVNEIASTALTPAKQEAYLLQIAEMNAAFYILRDEERRQKYESDRAGTIALEEEWRAAVESGSEKSDNLRRQYEGALKHFLAAYMEEYVLEAGRDKECVENSHWDPSHERHASRVLRHHRQRLYQKIHERLPYYEITPPTINWDERARVVASTLAAKG